MGVISIKKYETFVYTGGCLYGFRLLRSIDGRLLASKKLLLHVKYSLVEHRNCMFSLLNGETRAVPLIWVARCEITNETLINREKFNYF